MKTEWKVPHDKDGNQISWGGDINWKGGYETEPYEFEATLEYNGFSRGRSALNIKWTDVKEGISYTSGMYMLDDVLKRTQSSRITGRFGFKKQGTSVLLELIS